ncbi:MAG: type II toxin-antitoxin system death-on-curing family toxin [Candidatus Nanopelagicales bacterium]|nr:type II toxin-antitoxin system death-on-curing family toxin [Candidatus Nanopelagicales bacterium]
MTTDFLTIDDLLEIARGILPEVQVRDLGLLESACARPQASVFGDLAYQTINEQAAALIHSLARNHPLIDGNKRLAWTALKVFLLLNDVTLSYTVDDAEKFVLQIARGEINVPEISTWVVAHTINR